MSEPFIGEIRMVGFNFAPRGWADCSGQLLPINQYIALFSLFGTTYGGNGETSFGLPDLQSRVPIHQGQGTGLSDRRQGQRGGLEDGGLLAHSHPLGSANLQTTTEVGNQTTPDGHRLARANDGENNYSDGSPTGGMALSGNTASTGSPTVSNMPPFLTVRFVVALEGIFPSAN